MRLRSSSPEPDVEALGEGQTSMLGAVTSGMTFIILTARTDLSMGMPPNL